MTNALVQQPKDAPIVKMNNFLNWYAKLKNVNPITNEKFDHILERLQSENR